ncbi:helix-turn-helix transcriptional regulator [Streptomonospora salina]|uniref:Putative DNA-binding transcriptional regulator YafY n=1 Tax=Streptomonospora salina TaxID=104205 RepID=A0A841EA96_9ACTN|nr:WYL domain-containing protein [Streptomonospora salina]MBB6000947.1 putative DNA-binding transcriptional regulator YafY [Streptomonospora salina]
MEPTSTRRDMPARLLRLLSLLQTRRQWPGAELAQRLGTSRRTLRRDVQRLRELDYAVDATTGTDGGYRLARGGRAVPPLLLDDEETVAAAIALATAAGSTPGIAEGATRALVKLQALLPARLRPQLDALGRAAAALPHRGAVPVDPARLALLAGCRRDTEVLAFDYRDRRGCSRRRRVEPYHLVTAQGRWYLIAYDPDRADWRIFRADRIADALPTRRGFTPRPLPAENPADLLARSLAEADYPHTAHLHVDLPADQVRSRLFHPVPGTVTPDGEHRCRARLTALGRRLAR